jgi:hypothetical protein
LRDAADGHAYQPTIHLPVAGAVTVTIEVVAGASTGQVGGPIAVPDLSMATDTRINVRVELSGSDPTTISVRAWPVAEREPRYWDLTVTDWTGSLQAAGSIGLGWQLLGMPPDSSVLLRFDDLLATTTDPMGTR